MRYLILFILCSVLSTAVGSAQTAATTTQTELVYLLKPARVFDGDSAQLHEGWVVLVRGAAIEAVRSAGAVSAPAGATATQLRGLTLMPGLIEAHSHVLLHPYSETPWADQVAREALSLRVARATNHLRNTDRKSVV